jgi:hypothetical protein
MNYKYFHVLTISIVIQIFIFTMTYKYCMSNNPEVENLKKQVEQLLENEESLAIELMNEINKKEELKKELESC